MEEMTFDADASKAFQEMQKLRQQWAAVEQIIGKVARTSEQSAEVASRALKMQSENTRALVAQYEQLRASQERNRLASDGLNKSFGEAGSMLKAGFATVLSTLGVGGVLSTLEKIKDLQAEWTKRVYETQRAQDEVARKFRVQSLMQQSEYRETLASTLYPVAQEVGMPITDVTEAATEMYSKGFSMPDILGKDKKASALKALLQGAQSAKYTGDKIQFANAIASYLKSTDQELTAENVTGALAPLVTLFQTTGIEAVDLTAISELSAFLKSYGAQQQEMFAAVGVMKDFGGLTASEGLTKLRNVMQILGAPGANREVADTLKAIGGDKFSESLDFVGENLGQVLENFDAALSQLGTTPEENTRQRHDAMAQIFGARNAAAAETLLKHRAKLGTYIKLQQDTGKYVEGVKLGTEGPFVASIRQANAKAMAEMQAAEKRADHQRYLNELEISEEEAEIAPWRRWMGRTAGWWVYGSKYLPEESAKKIDERAKKRLEAPEPSVAMPKAEPIREVKPAARGKGPSRSAIDFSRISRDSTDTGRYQRPEQVAVDQAQLELEALRTDARREQVETEKLRGPLTPGGKERLERKYKPRSDAVMLRLDEAKLRLHAAELTDSAAGQQQALERARADAVSVVGAGGAAITPGEQEQIELLKKQYELTQALLAEIRKRPTVSDRGGELNPSAHREPAAVGAGP